MSVWTLVPVALRPVTEIVGMVGAVVFLVALFVLIWKRALLDVQERAIAVQAKTLEEYERRIKELEKRTTEQDREIARLGGVIAGKDNMLKQLVDAIAETDRCLNAPNCERRAIPTI